MNELILKIEQWAEDRNLIKGSDPLSQAMKLFSEAGELADNIGKGRCVKDDIGDVLVVMIIISKQLDKSMSNLVWHKYQWADNHPKKLAIELMLSLSDFAKWASLEFHHNGIVKRIINILNGIAIANNTTLDECLAVAYNDIKDRKGIMHDGIFIKESDPRYAELVK